MMPSKSRRLKASVLWRVNTAKSRGVADSGIPLPPLPGEAFGGSTGLLDVGVESHTYDLAVLPHADCCVAQFNLAACADWTALHGEYAQANSITEVENLLCLGLVLLVGG